MNEIMFCHKCVLFIIRDDTVKVLSTFKHLSSGSRMAEGTGLAFEREYRLVDQIRLEIYKLSF